MKKILHFLLLLILSSLATMTVCAEDKYLQVLQTDGQIVNINLGEEPKTTYMDGQLIITTAKAKIHYPLEKVHRYTYHNFTTEISPSQAMRVLFSDDGETMNFLGIKPQTAILVYNVTGQLIRSINSGYRNNVVVSVTNLPVGVYFIKANGVSYKISKK